MITPLYELSGDFSNRIFIKRDDLLPFSLGGNKVRIAQAFFDDMQKKGCDVMVAYGNTRSNLCRVLANMCCQKKVPCYILCSHEDHETASTPTANSRLMERLNAVLVPCDKHRIAEKVDEVMGQLAAQGHTPYYIYGNRLGRGNEGVAANAYAPIYQEILTQGEALGVAFDYLFLPSGTGATQSGLLCGHLLARDHTRIVGISVSRDKTRGTEILADGVKSWFALKQLPLPADYIEEIQLEDGYRRGGYGCFDDELVSFVYDMFLQQGIPMDPTYTGKAFSGMLSYLREQQITGKNVLFLHTGGTPLFYDLLA